MESLFQTRIKRQLRRARARSKALHAKTVAAALAELEHRGSRSGYAAGVIEGLNLWSRWSGADLHCTYRITSRSDGYYVVGNGFLCPVEGREDGEQLIAELTGATEPKL